jgi:SAM-dependent methyltransferase
VTPREAEDFERERLDADRRYNDALTELDRVLVAAKAEPEIARDGLARLGTALIVFLQQITAFVETKDRQLAADAARRFAALAPALEALSELRTQMGVLQRTAHALARSAPGAPDLTPGTEHAAPRTEHMAASTEHVAPGTRHPTPGTCHPAPDVVYLAFEDQFRGSDEAIRARLREYVPLFTGASEVVDLGCGRGEFLAALKDAGVVARGVDANQEMAATGRERGLDVVHGDALAFLVSFRDASVGGLMAAQVVEHLEPAYLMRLLTAARQKLKAGAPIVLETINPACWLAFFSSYIRDPTHVRPIHPETLQYLVRAHGFERVSIRYSAPVPDHMKMRPVELGIEVMRSGDPLARALVDVGQALNANTAILNNLLFSNLDYAVVGYRT